MPVCNVGLYGRIATLRLVRPAAAAAAGACCELMVTTERFQFMVLAWDAVAKGLRTLACGDLRVRGAPAPAPPASLIAPSPRA